MLPGARAEGAAQVGEWLRREVETIALLTGQGPLGLTVSTGMTSFVPLEHGPIGATTVLEVAAQALRTAKETGRNRVVRQPLEGEVIAGEEVAGEEDENQPGLTRYR